MFLVLEFLHKTSKTTLSLSPGGTANPSQTIAFPLDSTDGGREGSVAHAAPNSSAQAAKSCLLRNVAHETVGHSAQAPGRRDKSVAHASRKDWKHRCTSESSTAVLFPISNGVVAHDALESIAHRHPAGTGALQLSVISETCLAAEESSAPVAHGRGWLLVDH